VQLWEDSIAEQCERRAPESARLVSLGAGNGEGELPLAARLAERGVTNLELVLLELNPVMIDRALELAAELGLGDRVRGEQADLNTWVATEPADIYIASHSMHHVVELEHLYDEVARTLDPDGVVLVNDMVGRNGHVRWPEAGQILRRIWTRLPERYRYNHYTRVIDDEYPDVDCSNEGFEGIRAQDVLPLLLERFHPEVFVGFASVIDPFIDRVYGPNIDVTDPADLELLGTIAQLDDAVLELGIVTPTHLIASFRAKPVACRYPGHRSPERCVRDPRVVVEGEAGVEIQTLTNQLEEAHRRYAELRERRVVRAGLALVERGKRLLERLRSKRSGQQS
jgi:SAM-dependent methyltransferase